MINSSVKLIHCFANPLLKGRNPSGKCSGGGVSKGLTFRKVNWKLFNNPVDERRILKMGWMI